MVAGPIPARRTGERGRENGSFPAVEILKPQGFKERSDAPIAQLVEQIPLKDMVVGSNPTGCTGKTKFNMAIIVYR